MKFLPATPVAVCALLAATAQPANALEWSDNSIGLKYGTRWSEPGISEPIQKTVYEFVHISGDKLGTNLVVGQVLAANSKYPAAGGGEGSQEFFGFYRRTFSLTKLTGSPVSFGPVKDVSLAARFDRDVVNTDFAPSARKLLAGLSVDFAVPKGFVLADLYVYSERNYNGYVGKSVKFDTTYRADLRWSLPFEAGVPFTWNGGIDLTGTKGKDGFGNVTKAETRLYTEVLASIGNSGLKAGLAYEWWRNKYGTDPSLVPGTRHSTPQVVVEYHF